MRANTTAITAMMINRTAGTKIKIITGYKGLRRVFQAIEQKELDGVSATVVNPNYLAFHKKYAASPASTPFSRRPPADDRSKQGRNHRQARKLADASRTQGVLADCAACNRMAARQRVLALYVPGALGAKLSGSC